MRGSRATLVPSDTPFCSAALNPKCQSYAQVVKQMSGDEDEGDSIDPGVLQRVRSTPQSIN